MECRPRKTESTGCPGRLQTALAQRGSVLVLAPWHDTDSARH
jgi:hypothetical protein